MSASGAKVGVGIWQVAIYNQDMKRKSYFVRIIWAICLVIGGLNHARILFQYGLFWDYGGVALESAIYWSSLTILDPAVAGLLFVRPKLGILCTIFLIVTNVIHNLYVTALWAPAGELVAHIANFPILSQTAFMIFVLATTRIAWKGLENSNSPLS